MATEEKNALRNYTNHTLDEKISAAFGVCDAFTFFAA
jgi:hypothetical protein